jgi:acetyl esterase
MLARDRNGPKLRYQAMIYPALDPGCESGSMRALARGYMLTQDMMKWFWAQYLSSPADATNPLAAPIAASPQQLAGLPPATILTAEYDPPRDEGEAYGEKLRAAGVPVVARRYLGMIHGFASLPFITEVANRALADLGADLRAALTA